MSKDMNRFLCVYMQEGGRSFKDRKPIGEVSCCDAWIAEQTP